MNYETRFTWTAVQTQQLSSTRGNWSQRDLTTLLVYHITGTHLCLAIWGTRGTLWLSLNKCVKLRFRPVEPRMLLLIIWKQIWKHHDTLSFNSLFTYLLFNQKLNLTGSEEQHLVEYKQSYTAAIFWVSAACFASEITHVYS